MVTDFRSFRLIVPVGTQIVLRSDIVAEQRSLAKGMVGEITKTPYDHTHSYRVKLPDGFELSLHRQDFSILKQVKAGPVGDSTCVLADYNLREHVIYSWKSRFACVANRKILLLLRLVRGCFPPCSIPLNHWIFCS